MEYLKEFLQEKVTKRSEELDRHLPQNN
jgi:hypothetical protein